MEHEGVGVRRKGDFHRQNLLGNYTEHLDADSVKLIQTKPSTGIDKAEELALHHANCHLLGAVEYNTLYSHILGEVFHAFGLACSGWPLRGTAEMDVECGGDRHPTTVGKRSDGQLAGHSEVLVAVAYLALDLPTYHFRGEVVVEPELLRPVEVLRGDYPPES